MSIFGTYLWAVSLYANWRTAVSCGVLLLPVAVAVVIARITAARKG